MTRPSDSGASGVDWSGELEAVGHDGQVAAVELHSGPDGDGDYRIAPSLPGGYDLFCADGSSWSDGPWRIRNRQPQPADTVTVGRMTEAEARSRYIERLEPGMINSDAAVALLLSLDLIKPDPVDPDVLVVRATLHAHQRAMTPPDSGWGNMSYLKGSYDNTDTFKAALAAYRATAEKALAWGEGE